VDPALMRADPPPEAAAQEGKDFRELTVQDLLEFLTHNYESMVTLEEQLQGLAIEEKILRLTDMSKTAMAERGISEPMLAHAFAQFESDDRVREIALKAREYEQRLMAEIEVPSWLTSDKLLEIMRDLQEANSEIFPQIVQAELSGHMTPELMEKCVLINQGCYQKHGVTEMQLQTAVMKYQADPTFAAQISAQQAEANARAQALVAQLQGGQEVQRA